MRTHASQDAVYSNAKAKRLLGWVPVDTLERYVRRASPRL
jgi:nucleoside-diphosphate-sugar epimerase